MPLVIDENNPEKVGNGAANGDGGRPPLIESRLTRTGKQWTRPICELDTFSPNSKTKLMHRFCANPEIQ
jgi:hypothetical protein